MLRWGMNPWRGWSGIERRSCGDGEHKTMKAQTSTSEPLPPAAGSDLHRPTLLAVRLRLIAMYESCDALAKKCEAEEGGQDMANNVREQAFGLRKARMMLGSMLDEQQCHAPASAHVAGVSDMPATTQAAMSNMIVCAMEAIERGDFDDQND